MDARRQSSDDIRAAQRRHWTSVAGDWAHWLDWTEHNFGPLTRVLAERTGWTPGASILDVGCGSGYPTLTAAAAVAPSGRVTGIDLSPGMLAATADRAAALGLANVALREMDAESLAFDDDTFDAATCVCALMFCPNPRRAIREIRRVLKPRGRFAVVVWDAPGLNPFVTTLIGVIGTFIPLPPPPEAGAPGPFRFAPEGELETVVSDGGFTEFVVERQTLTFEFDSVDHYLELNTSVTGLKRRLASLTAADVSRLKAALTEAVASFTDAGRVKPQATLRCVFGRK